MQHLNKKHVKLAGDLQGQKKVVSVWFHSANLLKFLINHGRSWDLSKRFQLKSHVITNNYRKIIIQNYHELYWNIRDSNADLKIIEIDPTALITNGFNAYDLNALVSGSYAILVYPENAKVKMHSLNNKIYTTKLSNIYESINLISRHL